MPCSWSGNVQEERSISIWESDMHILNIQWCQCCFFLKEFISYIVMTIFLLIAGIISAASARGSSTLGACAVSGCCKIWSNRSLNSIGDTRLPSVNIGKESQSKYWLLQLDIKQLKLCIQPRFMKLVCKVILWSDWAIVHLLYAFRFSMKITRLNLLDMSTAFDSVVLTVFKRPLAIVLSHILVRSYSMLFPNYCHLTYRNI